MPSRESVMTIACADCGAVQGLPDLPPSTIATCHRCGNLLDQADASGLTVGMAWALTIFLLLIPANVLPLMRVSLQNQSRQAYIFSGVTAVWDAHWPILAVMFLLFTIVFPFIWVTLMTSVLISVRLGFRPRWLGRAYRYAHVMRFWAMHDVLIIAGLVIYMRTTVELQSQVDWGGWCLIASGVLFALMPECISRHMVWRMIMPDRPRPADGPSISCASCNLILPASAEGTACPRCHRRLHMRKLNSMYRTAALVVASYILYFPAYYYPMNYSIQPNGVKEHTIISGVGQLMGAGFWGLAAIIFTASVLIPMFKLIALSWLLMSVHRRSKRHLHARTELYRIVHKIGRWSNTDPFIVALMVPLMSFPGVADVNVGKAALPFALVVTLTMLAARSFDPKLMWDAAEGRL